MHALKILALVLLLAPAAAWSAPAAAAETDPVQACRDWIHGRDWSQRASNPKTRVLSPQVACFDGQVLPGSLDALHAWIDAASPATRPLLVIRSGGGDARLALELAEKLQARNTRVHLVDVCASSCANYFYAGVRDRQVDDGTLVLFHGGFSDSTLAKVMAQVDAFLASPAATEVPDPEATRRQVRRDQRALRDRQDALYARIGVDPRIVHGIGGVTMEMLTPALCGQAEAEPDFLYFGAAMAARMGIAPASGRVEDVPVAVRASLDALDGKIVACRVPEDGFPFAGTR
jgi:hypothetical protein